MSQVAVNTIHRGVFSSLGVDTRNLSPNLMWQMSPYDRVYITQMCPRDDLGREAFLFRDTVLQHVVRAGIVRRSWRLAARCSHGAGCKAGYLGGPAALRGGSELRGIGRH